MAGKKAKDDEKDEAAKGEATATEGGKGEGEGEDGLSKKKIAGKKLVLFALLGLVLLLGGVGAALYFTGVIGGHKEAGEPTEGAAEEEAHGEKAAPIFFELPINSINLVQRERRQPSMLQLKVVLELEKEEDRDGITAATPRIVDSFLMYMRELSADELQGTAGLERLREELRLRVNSVTAPIKIKDVLFNNMIYGGR
jgi:flagellar FliL protein